MNTIYIINYKVKGSDVALKESIKTAKSWFNYFDGCWIIISVKTLQNWQDKLSAHIDKGVDHLLIIEVNLKDYNGWMPKNAWDWLKKQKGLQGTNL